MPATSGTEWRDGWRTVLVAAIGVGTTSIYYYTLGLMIAPLQAAFGWSAAQITVAPAIISVTLLLLASRMGALADRIGVYRLAVPGFFGFALAFAALGLAGPSIWSWYALWLLVAVVFTTTAPSLWATAIAGRFDRGRALAMSVAMCATGIVGFASPIAGAWAIGHGGWRLAYPVLGLGLLAVGGPILWLATRGGQAGAATADAPVSRPALPGRTFAQALRDGRFWMIALAGVLTGGGAAALVVHFVPICTGLGLTRARAAEIASIIGIAAIVGRLAIGALMDRLGERLVGTAVFVAPAAACLLLASGSGAGLIAAVILIGLATGAEFNILAVVVSRQFGMRAYGAIYGQIAAAFNVGIGFGGSIAALAQGAMGGYPPFLKLLGLILLLPPILLLAIGRAPRFVTLAEPEEAATLP